MGLGGMLIDLQTTIVVPSNQHGMERSLPRMGIFNPLPMGDSYLTGSAMVSASDQCFDLCSARPMNTQQLIKP